MIKNYLIIFQKQHKDGRYIYIEENSTIKIPALTLFDAVDYAHNTLELEGIKEVRLL